MVSPNASDFPLTTHNRLRIGLSSRVEPVSQWSDPPCTLLAVLDPLRQRIKEGVAGRLGANSFQVKTVIRHTRGFRPLMNRLCFRLTVDYILQVSSYRGRLDSSQ